MAVGDYISVDQLKAALRITSNTFDEMLALAISSASAQIDEHCDDKFWLDDEPTPRLYKPRAPQVLFVASFADASDTTVELDLDDDGVFEVTLDPTDWQAGPTDRRHGWPYDRIELLGSNYFPGMWPMSGNYSAGPYGSVYNANGYPVTQRARVRVTARWGWPEVPWQVRQACQILAIDQYKSKDMTGGAAGVEGISQRVGFGANPGLRVAKFNPQAAALLCGFRDPVIA